jgi:hypothetical protein
VTYGEQDSWYPDDEDPGVKEKPPARANQVQTSQRSKMDEPEIVNARETDSSVNLV